MKAANSLLTHEMRRPSPKRFSSLGSQVEIVLWFIYFGTLLLSLVKDMSLSLPLIGHILTFKQIGHYVVHIGGCYMSNSGKQFAGAGNGRARSSVGHTAVFRDGKHQEDNKDL